MATLGERLAVARKAVVGIFSEESAKEAFGLLSGIFPGQTGSPPTRGTREYLAAYSKMPWLRAVTDRIATKCATTEWRLFVQKKPGEKARRNAAVQRAYGDTRRKLLKTIADTGELTQIETHPLLDVLTDANSFQTGFAMRKVTQIHLDLVGEAFWLKERNALGVVSGVWPVPPDWIANTPTPANPYYRVSFRGWRGLIPDTEVVWFADPDPLNPYSRGTGTARSLSDELETDEYAAKHTKAWFYNSARPDLIIYPKTGGMREPDVKRLETDWLNRNQGFWKAFKPYFLTREVGVEKMDQNFRSMQLVQLREYERDTILQVFGMPPEILGVLSNSNRATITAADLVMGRYVVEPRLEFLRAVLQERLVPEYDERLIIDFESPVQDDKDYQLDVLKAAPQVASVDEWRHLAGLRPMDDDAGRVHFAPNSLRPLDPTEEGGLKPPPPPQLDLTSPENQPPGAPNANSTGEDNVPPPDEGVPPKGRMPWNLLGLR
jgi:HK97 family phage portal protein